MPSSKAQSNLGNLDISFLELCFIVDPLKLSLIKLIFILRYKYI
jgi:hypothetical protein